VCHLVGDFLLQTTWQAQHKRGGLGHDPLARRALTSHATAYTFAFVPAFVWLASAGIAPVATLALATLVWAPHLILDDGRLVRAYAHRVKHMDADQEAGVALLVDQAFHVLSLFLVALLVAAVV
jgi:hypothetical protein